MVDSMPSLGPSLFRFGLYFLIMTSMFGLLGMLVAQSNHALLNQIFSFTVLLPYLISFYLATQYFIKTYKTTPKAQHRWQFSLGCLIIFWAYTIITVIIGMLLTQTSFNTDSLAQLLKMPLLLLILASVMLLFNLMIFLVGFWFLGKPANIMLQRQKY